MLSGLLPERDLAQAAGSARAGVDLARGVGNALGHSDARRASAVGRRPGVGLATLHAARSRTSAGLGEAGLGIAASTSATNSLRPSAPRGESERDEVEFVVETFWI